jgi:hypothetical protein
LISGQLSFECADAAAVESAFGEESTKAAVSAAFAGSIAGGIDGVAAEDVQINGISAVRRLQTPGRSLNAASLQVDYMITTTVADIATKITTVDTTAVSTAVTTELQKVTGLEAVSVVMQPVTADSVTAMPKCLAQFQKVSMEMQKKDKAGKKTSDGVCGSFEGFATHCKKADYDGLDKDMKPTDDEGEITYASIVKMKDQMCSACGKGFLMLMEKMDGGRRLQGSDSGPTQAQCDAMDKFISDCSDKTAFDALELQCGGDDHGDQGHHGEGHSGQGHSGHHNRALGGHDVATGSGYGYGYGMTETTPAPEPQEGCYAGPACQDAFKAGVLTMAHGCCDCTRFGPKNADECHAHPGAHWFDGVTSDCAGMCYEGPAIIDGKPKWEGCYAGPLCAELFAEGHDWMPMKHGCCDCTEITETECTAGGAYWFGAESQSCGARNCIPDWRHKSSGPKCGDDGFQKYDSIKENLDEMKQGCGTA